MSNSKMTILNFIKLTNDAGISAVETAKEHLKLLNIKNKISSLLNDCGFQYNQKTKQWEQVEDKGITEDMTFEQFVEVNNLSDKYRFKGKQETKDNTKSNTLAFTTDEIDKLKAIIHLYDAGLLNHVGEVAATTLTEPINKPKQKIQDAINQLPRSTKKTRKTYSISESVVKDLDKFAIKRGLKLSDCIELAINDLIQNYK